MKRLRFIVRDIQVSNADETSTTNHNWIGQARDSQPLLTQQKNRL